MMIAIASAHVSAQVLTEGGLLWRPTFRPEHGRAARPFAEAAWADAAADALVPPYVHKLGGAFVALPFGGRAVPAGTPGWAAADGDAPLHGIAANATWALTDQAPERVTLMLDLPEPSEVARIEQTIACDQHAPSIDIELRITARREGRVPVGYHPVLRLPERAGDLRLEAAFGAGYTSPLAADMPIVAADARFAELATVPALLGALDLMRLPLDVPGEALLMLARGVGRVRADYADEGYRVELTWDADLLPNCLLWLHDRAGAGWPGGHMFRGLGIEPSASAFDLAHAVSTGNNPLTRAEERTALALDPPRPTVLRFRIAVEGITA